MTGQKGTAAELEAARRRNCLRLLGFDSRRFQTSRNAEIAAFSAVCAMCWGASPAIHAIMTTRTGQGAIAWAVSLVRIE
jgi:hypothetical protein